MVMIMMMMILIMITVLIVVSTVTITVAIILIITIIVARISRFCHDHERWDRCKVLAWMRDTLQLYLSLAVQGCYPTPQSPSTRNPKPATLNLKP